MLHLTRKTAQLPDLAMFSTQDSKFLLMLGENLFEAYIQGSGDKIIEMHKVLRTRIVRDWPWLHNLQVA